MKNPVSPNSPHEPKKENNEWRCECGKLLFKGTFLAGLLEVKCTRCKRMVYLQQFNSYTAQQQSFMATLALDGTVLTISKGVVDSLGYSEEDIIGKNFLEYINPNLYVSAAFWMEGIEAEKKKTSHTSLVLPLISKSGEERIFSLLIQSTHLAGKDIYLVIAEAGLSSADSHDKKVISKLAQKSRQQREGWDFIISSAGTIEEASGKSELGYEKEELINVSFPDLLESPNEEFIDGIRKQESFVLDVNLKAKSAKFQKYRVCFTPDFLAEPEKPAFIVALRPQEVPLSASNAQTSAA